MQSEQVPSQITPSTLLQPRPQEVNSASPVTPEAVASTLTSGESPLDFIRKNLAATGAVAPSVQASPIPTDNGAYQAQAAVPPQVQPQVTPAQPAATTATPAADPMPVFTDETPATEPQAEAAAPVEEDVEDEEPTPEVLQKEHYERLRAKAKEAKRTAKELAAKYEETTKELEKYKTGQVVPEVLQEQTNKIEKLSYYEKLHNLKASEEYREKFVAPVESKTEQLKAIFKDYNFNEEQLDDAVKYYMSAENTAQLNRMLSESFDVIGGQQVAALIHDIKGIQQEAKAAESEPSKVFEQLQREAAAIKQAQEVQRVTKIKETANSGWVDALVKIRNEGKIKELIRQESDPVFNQKFVDPILTKSAQEYGKLMTRLATNGLKEVDKELAAALAETVLRAVSHSVAVETRDNAVEMLGRIETVADRANMLLRPPIGGGVVRGTPAAPPAGISPQEAAKQLSQSILRPK